MKIIECVQGTEEWHTLRCGIPTSSNFEKIIMANGTVSKQRDKYLYKLAGERITGVQENGYKNYAMEIGTEREEEARSAYGLITDCEVTQVGICLSEGNHRYGCSPDGFVGDNGLLEIKCPLVATHVSYLLKGTLPVEYFQQIQGQLLVTGREWCDFMSYYPGLKPFIMRVMPDKKFIPQLTNELVRFCDELEEVVDKIRQ